MPSMRTSLAALLIALPLGVLARAETASPPRPGRVAEIVSVKLERLKDARESHRITVVGRVPTTGWNDARLRPIKERHPNDAVAGFEMAASPPPRGTKVEKTVTEITATLETTIGLVQHTLVVRGRKNLVGEAVTHSD